MHSFWEMLGGREGLSLERGEDRLRREEVGRLKDRGRREGGDES